MIYLKERLLFQRPLYMMNIGKPKFKENEDFEEFRPKLKKENWVIFYSKKFVMP